MLFNERMFSRTEATGVNSLACQFELGFAVDRYGFDDMEAEEERWIKRKDNGRPARMNNGSPNEIFQFAAGYRNISLPPPTET